MRLNLCVKFAFSAFVAVRINVSTKLTTVIACSDDRIDIAEGGVGNPAATRVSMK